VMHRRRTVPGGGRPRRRAPPCAIARASPHLRGRQALPPSSCYRFFSPSPVMDLGPTQGRAACLLFLRSPTAPDLTSRVPWNSLMWAAGCCLNALSVLLEASQFPAPCSYIFFLCQSKFRILVNVSCSMILL
jgi:hypothetical protein